MAVKFYVDGNGKYLGGFENAEPPPNAIEVPVQPEHGADVWGGTVWRAAPEQVRVEQIRAIDKIKLEKLAGGFAHGGVSWPCDGVFQQQVTAFLVAWDSGVLAADATVTIRAYDDTLHQLGRDQVRALAAALLVYVQGIYAEAWAAKDALP